MTVPVMPKASSARPDCSSPGSTTVGSSGSVAAVVVAGVGSMGGGLVGAVGATGAAVVAGMTGAVSGGPIGVAVWGGPTGGGRVVSGSVVAGGSAGFGVSLWMPGVRSNCWPGWTRPGVVAWKTCWPSGVVVPSLAAATASMSLLVGLGLPLMWRRCQRLSPASTVTRWCPLVGAGVAGAGVGLVVGRSSCQPVSM